jgi:hypothetical protein
MGQRLLPYLAWKDAELTIAEQKKALIPEENMIPLFTAHEPPATEAAVAGSKRAGPAKRGGAVKRVRGGRQGAGSGNTQFAQS